MDRRTAIKKIGAVPLVMTAVNSKNAFANLKESMVEAEIWSADEKVSAYFVEPENSPTGAVLLIHEWWGLNRQIKEVALQLAELGYLALAVDLYGGKVADSPDLARNLMNSVHLDTATETLVNWVQYLRNHPNSNGKVGNDWLVFWWWMVAQYIDCNASRCDSNLLWSLCEKCRGSKRP